MRAKLVLTATIALLSAGCQGGIGDGSPQSGNGNAQPGSGGGASGAGGNIGKTACQASGSPVSVPSPLQRLSRSEYTQSTNDLLNDKRSVGQSLPVDDDSGDLGSGARSLIVTSDWLNQAMQAAEDLASTAIKSVTTLAPCAAGSADDACARSFITSFGKRAYRRPVTPDEITGLMGIYAMGKANADYSHGIELVIRAVLLSPAFLYKVELGVPGSARNGILRLTPYEVATRLSFMLWGTTPGDDLLTLADAGTLTSGSTLRDQAKKMMQDPRAREPLIGLHQRWLGVDGMADVSRDPMVYPTFGPAMMASMQAEAHDFLNDVIWNKGATLDTLFTSTSTVADATVAALYAGQDGAGPGGTPAPLMLNPMQRSGALTLPALIATHTFADESEPVHRGKFVRERLLCTTLPDPPANVMATPPVSIPGVSIRDRFAQHSSQPACQGCHALMDPIGFGFEHYDGLGRWRDMEQGKPVDATGTITMSMDVNGAFNGIPDLAHKLLGSEQVHDCVVSTFVAMTRGAETAADACLLSQVRSEFDAAKSDVRSILIAIAGSDSFLTRPLLAGEMAP